jgi:hypothetical protein
LKPADGAYYRKNSQAESSSALFYISSHIFWLILVILCILYCVFSPDHSHAESFHIPEKLVYDLTWIGLKAGTASLEIINEEDTIKIISQAHSAKFISLFYKVEDRIESTLSQGSPLSPIGQPINYRIKIREGKHRRDKEVIFDHVKGKAHYFDYRNNEEEEFEVPSPIFDPVSGFFYFRTRELVVGEPVYITVFDNKKIWDVEVQVLRKEQVTIPAGTFDTIVVKPLLKSEGIFSRKGEVHIWLTDDERHVPVLVTLKVKIGHVTATLVEGMY